jgi:hypothetical protein
MGCDWGRLVRWCRMFDTTGDFCRLCLLATRLTNYALGRHQTLIDR